MRRILLMPSTLSVLLLSLTTGNVSAQEREQANADWHSWRGSQSSGSLEGGDFPTELNPEQNLAWKFELPGKGCSTPIVVGDSIYITAPADGQDALVCLDRNGQQQWLTKFSEQEQGKHRNGSGSNASPVSDGDAVFSYFKSGTLVAVEKDGSIRWQDNLVERFGKVELYWDHGTSPILTDKYVVMVRMHAGDSWVAAFDKLSGDLVWKVDRNYETPREGDQGYATPVLIEFQGKPAVLVYGAEHLTIHDVADGKMLWQCGGFNPDKTDLWPTIAMPVVVDDVAVVAAGRNDRREPLLYGVKLDGSGDVSETNVIWNRDDIGTFVPSPAVWEGHVYLVRDRGEVECFNPADGTSVWRETLPKHRSNYYASPLIAGGLLYCAREDGTVFVIDIRDRKFNVLAEAELEESVIGSAVPLGKQVLVRGENHLFCFGE
ncbi:outer membrane biogenesis protein BamB [Novipirellula aureliae]|uniref:Outer membrane biogenesis protein BamB n=1 Tax=Novipirellula aureliae TaxID=2527966 RepID=A0A5C6DI55_9BACT|nr:PQQ-like beta-propeller repeat protein [Novipirellula aureliae]TWU34589.1 outer membrane biogenesis protein BamB [Novipirellula aureliae]